MRRSVLIYMSYAKFATQLEVAQAHIDAGDDVTIMECRSELLACNWNQMHALDRCSKCQQTRNIALSRLSSRLKVIATLKLSAEDQAALRDVPRTFTTTQQLRDYRFDGFDAGMATLSTLIDRFRNPTLDVRMCSDLVYYHLLPSVAVYCSVLAHLTEGKYDLVYVFNGRHSHTRPVVRACQKVGIEYCVLEDGWDRSHYSAWRNCTPHSKAALQKAILEQWNSGRDPSPFREQIAHSWFQKRAAGLEVHDRDNDRSYVSGQKPNTLPSGFDPAKINIAVFNTSEDEWAAIGDEWAPTIYESQVDGLRQLRKDLPVNSHVYLRIHPNLAGTSQLPSLFALQAEDFTVIAPESELSSYELLKASDVVLTYGSTMGVEATYHRKPSVLANCAAYDHLGCTYNPSSHSEVIRLLSDKLCPKPLENALIYGYYYASYGLPYKYYRPPSEMYVEGTINGELYREPLVSKYFWRVARRLPIVNSVLNRIHFRRGVERILGHDGAA